MLSRDKLSTAEAVFSLGLVIARSLQEGKPVTIFFNEEGYVELAPHSEVVLDVVPEEEAVEALLSRDYKDEQILAYLAGRRARVG
jgi:hypothetical protein